LSYSDIATSPRVGNSSFILFTAIIPIWLWRRWWDEYDDDDDDDDDDEDDDGDHYLQHHHVHGCGWLA